MIDYKKYDNIIFDFDGVIVDSNYIKEKCISLASSEYCDSSYHTKFVDYFINNNGVPREVKINKFFDDNISLEILSKYNDYLNNELKTISLTRGVREFISLVNFYKLKPFILSGGTTSEVIKILELKELDREFVNVMGGPNTKEENLDTNNIEGRTLFIGDSLKDYEVADKYSFDFIFLYGYTQFSNWKEFFKDKNILMCIKDFTVLTNNKC